MTPPGHYLVDTAIVQDRNISFGARGLYVTLAGLPGGVLITDPDDFIYVDELIAHGLAEMDRYFPGLVRLSEDGS